MLPIVIHGLSMTICAIWCVMGCRAVYTNHFNYWSEVPFGFGPAALPALAGFGVFPGISTILAAGCLIHAIWYYNSHKEPSA